MQWREGRKSEEMDMREQPQRQQMSDEQSGRRRTSLRSVGVLLGLVLALYSLLPLGPGRSLIPVASAHAILLRSDPVANAQLQAPPSQVRLWFSENVNPGTSRVVVVDPTNRQVDSSDSHVNPGDSTEMDVSLPLLSSGAYIVIYQTQSADDGHVTGGSFIFRILRADGSLPPLPTTLPTGHFPGAGGVRADGSLGGAAIFPANSTWLALLAMTFWVGGLIWEPWVLPPGGTSDPDLRAAARAASRRFREFAPEALGLVLIADLGIVLGQAAQLGGGIEGALSPPLMKAILFGSRFGLFWWIRQLVVGAALVLTLVAERRNWFVRVVSITPASEQEPVPIPRAIPEWRQE